MTGLRGSAHHTLATPTRLAVRPITLALGALLVTAVLAVAIVLATSGGSDQAGATKSDSVAPSTPLPPSAAQRHQPPGVNGPGARPQPPPVGPTGSGPPTGGPDQLCGGALPSPQCFSAG
jgi:hypothetical protein